MTQPLHGIRVLDFSTLLPGPMAGLILAEAGAEVIKIERPGYGEEMRLYEPRFGDTSANFALLNRGKKSLALDLKDAGTVAKLRTLIAGAHVILEQFRPGVMARLGLGYDDARTINPAIIYCSITGYGQTGPKADTAAHDLNYIGDTGLLALSAGADGAPIPPPGLIADIGGGALPAVINILLALREAERTGRGTHLDIAMCDNVFAWQYWAMATVEAEGRSPAPGRELVTGGSPRYRLYRTADGRFAAVAALEQKFWDNLCGLLGLPAALRDDRRDPDATAQAESVASSLRKRMASFGSKATIGQVATVAELVPEGQLEKKPILEQIAKTLGKFDFERLDPAERRDAERLERMAHADPFGLRDLPKTVLAPFEARDGSGPGHFVLAFPTVSMSDGPAVRELARQVEGLEAGGGLRLSVAGEPMVMADILETVERDAPRILAVTLLLVAFTLRITAGTWAAALLAAFPAVLTAAASAGLLSLLGMELNYLNMVMLPILLGIGVDDGMHIVTRVAEGEALETVWRHTGWNIFGAILTDMFGFGSLALAAHPGLASFGRVALVGLAMNLLICVVLLPAFLATRQAFARARLASRNLEGDSKMANREA